MEFIDCDSSYVDNNFGIATFAASTSHIPEVDIDNMLPYYDLLINNNVIQGAQECSLPISGSPMSVNSIQHSPISNPIECEFLPISHSELCDSDSESIPENGSKSSQSHNVIEKAKKHLNSYEKHLLVEQMLKKSNNGKLKRGSLITFANTFNVSRWTVQRVWKALKQSWEDDIPFNYKRKGVGGRKAKAFDPNILMSIPMHQRGTMLAVGAHLGCSASTVHRMIKRGEIRKHTSTLKPLLSMPNKIQRMKWCLNQLERSTLQTTPLWKDMYNVVHIDEKWFVMTEIQLRCYLVPEEINPHRTVKNKNYLGKIMFLVAVARPRFNADGFCTFDGKIGCFPLTEMVPAQRSSANRPRGTLELKPIQKITREVIRNKFIQELIPAIKQKWPLDDNGVIFIQQDNVTPHIVQSDQEFTMVARDDGFNIQLISQPPQSPDLNILDLGFFRAIDAIQHKQGAETITGLVDAVMYAYSVYEPSKLNKIFLTLQNCMEEVLKRNGNNNYDVPHVRKDVMQRRGELPTSFSVSKDVIQSTLSELEMVNGIDDDLMSLRTLMQTTQPITNETEEIGMEMNEIRVEIMLNL